MNILTVIPICKADAARAEMLLDLIYALEPQKKGHVLLAYAADVHEEMRDKINLTAALAFAGVEATSLPHLVTDGAEKSDMVWETFHNIARHVSQHYRWPWLWLEPDCVVLKSNWREEITEAYDSQPKRYLSRWLKTSDGKTVFAHRVGVYPANIMRDIEIARDANMPFDIALVSHSNKTDLIQQLAVTDAGDVDKVRANAVILHHDKAGVLMDWVRKQIPQPKAPEPIKEVYALEPIIPIVESPKRRGRPRKNNTEPVIV